MANPLHLFILAGEPSGDRIGADLVRRLRVRCTLTLSGVGGDDLIREGLAPLFAMGDLAVMGLSDVARRLPLLLWRLEQTARAILRDQPDVVVLIDAQAFSTLLAKRLRGLGYRKPVLLYVAPSVWARAPERAKKLVPLFDEVLAVLPFEPEIMRRLGGPPTYYVGHPAVSDASEPGPEPDRIALLPGSRAGELRRHLPLLRDVAGALAAQGYGGFYMPTLSSLEDDLKQAMSDWPVAVDIVTDRAARAQCYAQTRLAIATAGTVTLELALASVPMVITYVMDGTQKRHFAKLGHPRVGLPNIILEADVTPELILARGDAQPVIEAAGALLGDATKSQAQIAAFRRLRAMMQEGLPEEGRYDPAERILSHVAKA